MSWAPCLCAAGSLAYRVNSVTTVETTSTNTATEVVQQTVTATVTRAGPQRRVMTSTLVASVTPSCNDLTKKNLLRYPASRLSSACSCLNPQPTTVTIGAATAATSTATATETTVVTVVETTQSASTEVVTKVVTEPVTVTSVSADDCPHPPS